MPMIGLPGMRAFLNKSLSSLNDNKMNGLLAEVSFRRQLEDLGFGDRVSAGGWIVRNDSREGRRFAEHAAVFFPEEIRPNFEYSPNRQLPSPDIGLHTICATFHQIGIRSYFCAARDLTTVERLPPVVQWSAKQLGLPTDRPYEHFPDCLDGFAVRARPYTFLRYNADVARIPEGSVAKEFSKESLRVAFQNRYHAELSDLDGPFWGHERTYPLEIKEKTVAEDRGIGQYFGIDIGPFVKLAYYAAKRGNLHSMFVVREIDDTQTRNLVEWWFVTFEILAQYASWNFRSGGRAMGGGTSATVRVPRSAFKPMTAVELANL